MKKIALSFFLISFATLSFSSNSSDTFKEYCKTSYKNLGAHLIKISKEELALKCVKNLSNVHKVSFDIERERVPSFWDEYFSSEKNSLFVYNKYITLCGTFMENKKKICDRYREFFLQATLNGDSSFLEQLKYDTEIIKEFYEKSQEGSYSEIRNKIVSERERYFYENFNVDCSNYEDFKNFDYLGTRQEFQFELLDSMYFCLSDADDLYIHKLINDIVIAVDNDSRFLSTTEFRIITNAAYYLSNLGPDSTLKKLDEILLKRFDLIDLQNDLVNTWLDFKGEYYWADILEGISLLYLNMNDYYLRKSYVFMEEYIEERNQFIEIFIKNFYSGPNKDLRQEVTIYGDSGLKTLMLQRQDGSKSCDLAANYFDQGIKELKELEASNLLYKDFDWLNSFGSNLLMLSNCYLEAKYIELEKMISLEDRPSFTSYKLADIKKSKYYLLEVEKIFTFLKRENINIPVIENTLALFIKERINFIEERNENHIENLNSIFDNFLNQEPFIENLFWDDLLKELIFSYAGHLNYLEKSNSLPIKVVSLDELNQLRERLINAKALEFSMILNSTTFDKLKENLITNSKNIDALEKKIEENYEIKKIKDLEFLYLERQRIIKKIYSANEKFNKFKNSDLTSLNKFVQNLNKNEAILSFQTSASGISINVRTKEASQNFFSPLYNEYLIDILTKDLRDSLEKGYKDDSYRFDLAFLLYRALFEQVDNYLGGNYTVYLFGAELEDLPFPVLISSEIENQNDPFYKKIIEADWLIDDYNFLRIYPVNNEEKKYFKNKFLGIANSTFTKNNLSHLSYVEEEIKDLALSSQSNENIFFGDNATKQNFITFSEQNFERIAIATHSIEPYWNGLSSEPAIVFNDKNDDYILSASEISVMNIESDIVVLSVCNSDFKDFNAIYKSFLVAGSNSVLYAHWELNDEAAPELTDAFFKRLWFNPSKPKHESLRDSILEIKSDFSDNKFAHPFFWGSFGLAYGSIN